VLRGSIHHGEYLYATTTSSIELKTYLKSKVSNLALMGQSAGSEWNLWRSRFLGTSVHRGAGVPQRDPRRVDEVSLLLNRRRSPAS
jgi:hypothetical protein